MSIIKALHGLKHFTADDVLGAFVGLKTIINDFGEPMVIASFEKEEEVYMTSQGVETLNRYTYSPLNRLVRPIPCKDARVRAWQALDMPWYDTDLNGEFNMCGAYLVVAVEDPEHNIIYQGEVLFDWLK